MDYLRPDGKTQVTVEYDENNQPVRVDTVVLSTQHSPKAELDQKMCIRDRPMTIYRMRPGMLRRGCL